MTDARTLARQIFLSALEQSSIESAFSRHVEYSSRALRVCEDLYPLHGYARIFVLALGKAAHTMAAALTNRVGPIASATGIIACPVEPPSQLPGFRYFHGGHPVPNEESIAAARAAMRAVSSLTEDDLAIFLVSGGGSAVLEKPLFDEISLEDLISTYRLLVNCGATIEEINAIRKHLSAVKGGRLAAAAAPAQQLSILVSDVPDNAPDALASGPTMPDRSTAAQCYAIAERYKLLESFPASVREIFVDHHLEDTPKADDPAFLHSRWWTILSNHTLRKHAATAASEAGFAVEIDNSCDDWEYSRAANYLLEKLQSLRQKASHACLISGGEVTVRVPQQLGEGKTEGRGGRNQHFALYCAEKIAGQNIVVLSAGSDGIDGNSPATGAIADGTTLSRAGADAVKNALAAFDSFSIFDGLGDAIVTGPTGNNVRDLRMLFGW